MFGYLTQDLKIACIYSMLMIGGLYGLVQGKQEISVHRYSRSTDEQAESRSSSRSSDEWSTVVRSYAQHVDCRDFGSIQNGHRFILWRGHMVGFSCNRGYCLLGSPWLMCGSDGVWNGAWPVCVRDIPECDDPGTPQFGSRFITGTLEGSTVNYSCQHPGYVLKGNSQRTCQHNGQWSGSLPVCKKVDCGSPRKPRYGAVQFSFTFYEWTVMFQCNFGYIMEGAASAVCNESGHWSRNSPTCRVVLCGHLWDPAHGRVSYETRMFGSTATYNCNYGYGLDGPQTRTCRASGLWSGFAPHCKRNVCDSLRNPKNGRVSYYSVTRRSVAKYTCNHGYIISGSWRRVCYASGWSGTEPTCNPIRCPVLTSPSNCSVTTSNQNQVYSVANYTCERGYKMIGNSTRQCRPNGMWSDQAPGCHRFDCRYLQDIPNGRVVHKGTTVGSEARYSCYQGFNLKLGDRIRTCLENGTWSGTKPCCIHPNTIIKCMPLQNPDNGTVELSGVKVGSIATYTCENGSFLLGDDERICQYNGKWSGQPPICIAVDCPNLEPPENGEVVLSGRRVGDNATYCCNIGFELTDSAIRTCLETGNWSGSVPTCTAVDCPDLEPPGNGEVRLSGRLIGDSAMYECSDGFELIGSVIRTCLQTGVWSGNEPECSAAECPNLEPPENGEIFITSRLIGGDAIYSCNIGFELTDSAIRTCLETGNWSGSVPTCTAIDCPDLEPPGNGEVRLSGRLIGDSAMYECSDGFELIGSVIRTCLQTGVWSGNEPECSAAECPNLEPPENGEIFITSRLIGGDAIYSCNIGFELTGSVIRTCLETGNWSGSAPTCIRQCEDPGIPVNGRRIIVPPTTNNFTAGTRVYFTCADGYEIQGTSTRQCQDNGTWTSETPGCLLANSSCVGTGATMDQFGRNCTCVGGQLESCSRYRRDWTTLTDGEKQEYISTVLTVATDSQYQPLYNLLVERYRASVSTLAQNTIPEISQFFPWHRYFLLEYEDLLHLVNRNITIPYWDWSLLPTDPYSSPVFDPVTGFGNSANNTTMCVTSGPFRENVFQVTPSAGKECLRRAYGNFTYPSRSIIQNELLDIPALMFDEFHRSLQLFLNLNVRCFVGGHMCEPNASNDPLYLLHLATIDLFFYLWQSLDAERATVRYAGDNTPLVLSFDNSSIVSNFFDNRNLPYNVSVRYAPQQNISGTGTPPATDNTDISPNASSVDPTCTATSTTTSTPVVTGTSTADATTTAIATPVSAIATPISAIATPTPIITAPSVVSQQLMAGSSSTHAFTIYHKITYTFVTMVAIYLFL